MINFGSQFAARVMPQGWTGIYPVGGQTGAPLVMGNERPDPVPAVSIKGSPLSLQSASGQTLTVSAFTLKDGSGNIVPGTILTRADTIYLRTNEAYFVPTGSLKTKTTYTVSFSGSSNGAVVNKSWTFTTAAQ